MFFFFFLISFFFFLINEMNYLQIYTYLYNMNFIFDVLSIVLLFTTMFMLMMCLFIAENKYFNKNKELFFLFFIFLFFFIGLLFSNNIFSFFIFYELLLMPSYMLVLKSSPNSRSKMMSNYFLFWTQLGSFFVLLGLFFLYSMTNMKYNNLQMNFFLMQILIFFGFGVKVPLWPFHFWLSKTHVEANTGFSIFLSGMLVKAAMYGLYKFMNLFMMNNTWFFLSICLMSMIDSSLKMCLQNDLKKLVAFSTMQEMGVMTLLLLLPTEKTNMVLYMFIIFHSYMSGLYFWMVDCVYSSFNTSVMYNMFGLNNISPIFSIFMMMSTYLFLGLPYTIKFSMEMYFLKLLYKFNFMLSMIIAFFINYISMVFFFKMYMYMNFGNNYLMNLNDLNKKEIFMFILFMNSIIFLNLI